MKRVEEWRTEVDAAVKAVEARLKKEIQGYHNTLSLLPMFELGDGLEPHPPILLGEGREGPVLWPSPLSPYYLSDGGTEKPIFPTLTGIKPPSRRWEERVGREAGKEEPWMLPYADLHLYHPERVARLIGALEGIARRFREGQKGLVLAFEEVLQAHPQEAALVRRWATMGDIGEGEV